MWSNELWTKLALPCLLWGGRTKTLGGPRGEYPWYKQIKHTNIKKQLRIEITSRQQKTQKTNLLLVFTNIITIIINTTTSSSSTTTITIATTTITIYLVFCIYIISRGILPISHDKTQSPGLNRLIILPWETISKWNETLHHQNIPHNM
jgi:hypothetical protein